MSENLKKEQELARLKEMFKDFKTPDVNGDSKVKKEDALTKYFSPRSDIEVFRPLPPLDGRKSIEVAFFHRVELPIGGGRKRWSTLYCSRHNDPKVPKLDEDGNQVYDGTKPVMVHAPCPLCDEYNRIIQTQDNSIIRKKDEELSSDERKIKERNKEIYKDALKWKADKYYIIKGIDKGAIKDGPKFWRFKHNWRNQGTLDKLLPIISSYTDHNGVPYYDVNKGADLTIYVTDSSIGSIKFKSIVSISSKQAPLHTDVNIANSWLCDDLIWRDVYKPKNIPNITYEQYLDMVVKGITPYWDESDQNNKRWVFPSNPELEKMANTRNMNLDDSKSTPIEQASDLNINQPPREITPQIDVVDTSEKQMNTTQEPKQVEQPELKTDGGIPQTEQIETISNRETPKIDVSSFVEDTPMDGDFEYEFEDLPF